MGVVYNDIMLTDMWACHTTTWGSSTRNGTVGRSDWVWTRNGQDFVTFGWRRSWRSFLFRWRTQVCLSLKTNMLKSAMCWVSELKQVMTTWLHHSITFGHTISICPLRKMSLYIIIGISSLQTSIIYMYLFSDNRCICLLPW